MRSGIDQQPLAESLACFVAEFGRTPSVIFVVGRVSFDGLQVFIEETKHHRAQNHAAQVGGGRCGVSLDDDEFMDGDLFEPRR